MTDTTTQWRGLHNPERHFSAFGTGTPLCEECGDALCVPSNPCYCCLEAEVEVLRAQNAALIGMVERDTAAIQRVRNEVNGDQPIPRASDDLGNVASYCAGYVDALRRVRRALDGDS